MESRKHKRKPQVYIGIPSGSTAPTASGSFVVSTWYTTDIDAAGVTGWLTTALVISATPIATVRFDGNYYYFDGRVILAAGGSATTSGIAVISMKPSTSPQSPQFIYGTLEATGETSTPSSRINSLTSSQPQSSPTTSAPAQPVANASHSSLGGGAIAGIAIGGVLLLALIIGGWYFWRRRKRTRSTTNNTTALSDNELAKREGDKMVLDTHQTAPTSGAYQTQHQEMSGNGLTQELDRSHSYKYAIGGVHELKAEDRPGELPYAGVEEHGSAGDDRVVGVNDGGSGRIGETMPVTGTNSPAAQASQVSPHVEAQRKREVEWLGMEETRMRQRREALLQQGETKS